MRSAVLTDWGKIEIQERPEPEPEAGEAILWVSYAGVCGSDVHIFRGANPIATTPRIPGHEFCGEVRALGADVSADVSADVEADAGGDVEADVGRVRVEVGQRVVVYPLVTCGDCPACRSGQPHVCRSLVVIGVNRDGGFCEYARVPARNLIPVADDVPQRVAALSEPFSIGYHALSRGRLAEGEDVLIIGAGAIGLYAGVVARARGARRVAFSEPAADRRALAEGLGFVAVDPTRPDALDQLAEATGGDGFALVVETSGVGPGLGTAQAAAAIRGRIVLIGFPADEVLSYNVTRAIVKEIELIGSRVCPREEFVGALEILQRLYREGETDFDAIIGAVYPLHRIADAIDETARAARLGKILIDPRAA